MKITTGQHAPAFTIKDVNGKQINLADYSGKKVLLTFYRNVGCPICNLRFHELQAQADYFREKNTQLLAVYESTPENMKMYVEGENPYAIMIPNADLRLYQLYEVEKGTWKFLKGLFNGAMGKMNMGKKLFKKKIKMDGNANRIGAEFLINEKGMIKRAHYGKFVGDDLPLTEIKQLIN